MVEAGSASPGSRKRKLLYAQSAISTTSSHRHDRARARAGGRREAYAIKNVIPQTVIQRQPRASRKRSSVQVEFDGDRARRGSTSRICDASRPRRRRVPRATRRGPCRSRRTHTPATVQARLVVFPRRFTRHPSGDRQVRSRRADTAPCECCACGDLLEFMLCSQPE
jgi:hypothetical protein